MGTEEDIYSEESEDELDMNEEYFFERIKNQNRGGNPIKRQIGKQLQNILCQLSLVWPDAKNAKTEVETWHCFITNNILDLILLYTNKCSTSVSSWFSRKRDGKQIDKTELKALLGLLI